MMVVMTMVMITKCAHYRHTLEGQLLWKPSDIDSEFPL